MSEYENTSGHALSIEGGKTLAPFERVSIDNKGMTPHDRSLVEDGQLTEVPAKMKGEVNG